jgi:hypothetical protein
MIHSFATRRKFLAVAAASTAAAFERRVSTVRSFWLFGLLRPECVPVHPVSTARLHCSDRVRQWIVEGDQPLCITKDAVYTRIAGPGDLSVVCTLEVPGVIRRTFFGVFEFHAGAPYVMPVVSMDCETATSCILGAELPVSAAHFHALAAQAVVSRSVILGTGSPRHAIADFCDTTHCQFLRSPAQRDSVAALAVEETSGYVLVENGALCRLATAPLAAVRPNPVLTTAIDISPSAAKRAVKKGLFRAATVGDCARKAQWSSPAVASPGAQFSPNTIQTPLCRRVLDQLPDRVLPRRSEQEIRVTSTDAPIQSFSPPDAQGGGGWFTERRSARMVNSSLTLSDRKPTGPLSLSASIPTLPSQTTTLSIHARKLS